MKRKSPINKNGKIPELTSSTLRQFRPAHEVIPNVVKAHKAGTLQPRGRPPSSNKSAISLRLDNDVIAALRATGAGWQTKVNDLLKAIVHIVE